MARRIDGNERGERREKTNINAISSQLFQTRLKLAGDSLGLMDTGVLGPDFGRNLHAALLPIGLAGNALLLAAAVGPGCVELSEAAGLEFVEGGSEI